MGYQPITQEARERRKAVIAAMGTLTTMAWVSAFWVALILFSGLADPRPATAPAVGVSTYDPNAYREPHAGPVYIRVEGLSLTGVCADGTPWFDFMEHPEGGGIVALHGKCEGIAIHMRLAYSVTGDADSIGWLGPREQR